MQVEYAFYPWHYYSVPIAVQKQLPSLACQPSRPKAVDWGPSIHLYTPTDREAKLILKAVAPIMDAQAKCAEHILGLHMTVQV